MATICAAAASAVDTASCVRPITTTRAPREVFRARDAGAYLAAASLLYVSHVLWLVFGVGWLFLTSLVHRVPLRTAALRFATAASALCVSRPGAQESIPSRAEVEAFLREHSTGA